MRAEDMTAAAASLAASFLPSDVLRKASRASAALAASAASAAAAVCATERGVAGAGARGGGGAEHALVLPYICIYLEQLGRPWAHKSPA